MRDSEEEHENRKVHNTVIKTLLFLKMNWSIM